MNVINQKPVVLSPVYQSKTSGDFDPIASLKQCVAEPLFTPLIAAQPVRITAKSGNVDADMIAQRVAACCGDTVQVAEETWCRTLYRQTLLNFDASQTLNMQDLFASQSGAAAKLPAPTPTCVYTPTSDVIPSAKKFLAGQASYDEFFASLAYFARVNTLGFYFANEVMFDDFKTWMSTQLQTLSAGYPAETNQMLQDFIANIKLTGLTESLILRNTDSDNNQEHSFARVIVSLLMNYATTITNPAEFGVLPFALGELFCPRTIVFVNVEQHGRATAAQVNAEWDLIRQSLANKINMVSNNRLTSLTAMHRHLKKIQGMAVTAAASGNQLARAANIRFRKTPPSQVDIVRCIKKVLGKMHQVARSENTYKCVKITYQKPNRRDPDDFNKPGKSVSVKYMPDIHVYIDTSGSISEENYQGAIKACIRLAQKLNVNLYFNSFSHTLSQCTHLNVKDKTLAQVYREFQKVPKVTGGTDYEQIWNYINKSKKRRRELSLIITDFEWSPRSQFVEHPKNLYYMPCAGIDWDGCVRYANQFAQAMLHNAPDIRKHILM